MDARPVMMAVDDDPEALSALSDALTRRFGSDYRVMAHASAQAGLDELERLQREQQRVALMIADQWMPEMTGREWLVGAHAMHPSAQRGLLVQWGDRSAASTILQGCAMGQLDNYLHKPWSPAEVYLYPAIGELLSAWTLAHGPRMERIRVVGIQPSPRVHELRSLLQRNGVPHGFYPADAPQGQQMLATAGLSSDAVPVVILPDGHALAQPTNTELSDALGITNLEGSEADLLIIGGGPAGLAAAVYAASEGLRTVVIEREAIGGQAGTSSLIRNYLGFPRGISGGELAQRAYEQAWLFGTQFVLARDAVSLRAEGDRRIVTLSDGMELAGRAVLIAAGAAYRRLEIPNLERFVGAGVFYASPAEPEPMAGAQVCVLGGGNSAGQLVVHAAKHAEHVLLLVRAGSLEKGMSDYLVQEIRRLPNVEIRLNTDVVDVAGAGSLEQVVVRDRTDGTTHAVTTSALFVLIGAEPHSNWLADTVQRDRHGFLLTGADVDRAGMDQAGPAWHQARPPTRFETSMPGVFAVGDIRHGSVKRVASAVGEGATTIQYVHEYLAGHPAVSPVDSPVASPAAPAA